VDTAGIEAKSKDLSVFERSLRQLHDNLLNDYVDGDHSIVIAMSRKGPRLLDCVFSKQEQQRMRIITEFAVPFLFRNLHRGELYHVYIVDDAVYYGSTLKNLVKELREYEKAYFLNLEIRAYVAVIDQGALTFNEVEVKGLSAPREGYGHYFVRQIMTEFRKKHQCLEVEFPIVTYHLERPISLQDLSKVLAEHFHDIYIVNHREGEVLTVLLERDDSQFCKIRIYANNKQLCLAFMMPRCIPCGLSGMEGLLDSMGGTYRKYWQSLYNYIMQDADSKNLSESVERNAEKSLVAIANYLFSYQYYIYYRRSIEGIFSGRGIDAKGYGVDNNALFRLIGIESFSDELASILSHYDRLVEFRWPKVGRKIDATVHQIYEESNTPSMEERRTLEAHNEHMVRNSRTYDEALSAVVFNQNLFVERWSRHGLHSGNRHLWSGYTHDVLLQLLRSYSRLDDEPTEMMVHEWLDARIDLGCVVPQYIIDNESGNWVRVFRPGENEDVLLSHLARYVLHIYQQIDRQLNLGFVPLQVLGYMLLVLHKRLWDGVLKDQFLFSMSEYERTIVIDEPEWKEDPITVIKYLRKMYILEVTDDEVSIAPRISDPEFLENTTLDDRALYLINQMVEAIMQKYKEQHIKYSRCDSFFNYYINRDVDKGIVLQFSKDIAKRVLQVVKGLLTTTYFPQDMKADEQTKDRLLECYHDIMKYDVAPGFYIDEFVDAKSFWETYQDDGIRAQHNFKALMMIINLLVGVYVFDNFENVKGYLYNKNTMTMMTLLKLDALKSYAENLTKELNVDKTRRNQRILIILRDYLEKISV
jgi:hypothetical protein